MGLLDLRRPKWQHPDWRVRQAALKDCSAQEIAQTALKDESLEVALTAVGMLSDDAVLADIARKAAHADVRFAAVHAVREQLVLADIAMTAPDKKIRETAVARVFAVPVLASIATRRDQEHLSVATSALAKIHDQEVLRQIAGSTAHPHVRASAVACLRDHALLATMDIWGDPQFRSYMEENLSREDFRSLSDVFRTVESVVGMQPESPAGPR
jgi:hypothetical protein